MTSTKLLGYALLVGIIAVALYFVLGAYERMASDSKTNGLGDSEIPGSSAATTDSSEVMTEGRVRDTELGISFMYPTGTGGYRLDEVPEESTDTNFVKGYRLMLQSDYEELQNTAEPREGPPTIMLRVYENPDNLWPAVWAMRNPRESNVELMTGKETETEVGGAKAVEYISDGLYPTKTYVVTNGNYVFVFTGSYIDESSPTKADFETIIDNVTFIPVSESQ